MSRRAGVATAVIMAVLALLLSGCVGLPTAGPVTEADAGSTEDAASAPDYNAQPPEPGASQLDIVTGFFDAMTAWPIETSVAKQYLTKDAARDWRPQSGTVVYSGEIASSESYGQVVARLPQADRLDGAGSWTGELHRDQRRIRFQMVAEDGEYRIANPMDALIVPSSWFLQRYRQVSLFFFDPLAQTLVPEPVYLPAGEQLATSLVSALMAGPPRGLADVEQTFLPAGWKVGLSVPVSPQGVAQIDLADDAERPAPEQVDLIFAQLAWTLRQDPGISAFRVSIGDDELIPANGSTPYDVNAEPRYDPAGGDEAVGLYGVREGALVRGTFGPFTTAPGPLGEVEDRRAPPIRSVAVDSDETRAAGVVRGGHDVVVAPLADGRARTVLRGRSDLDQPAWDAAGRLWVLDRTPSGARVLSIRGSRAREVPVAGITGTAARRLVVSRDGTRLVSIVPGRDGARVVVARVVLTPSGQVRRTTAAAVIRPADRAPVRDIAWSDVARVSVLISAGAGRLSEVETIPAVGGLLGRADPPTIVSGKGVGLAANPRPRVGRTIVVTPKTMVDVTSHEESQLNGRIRSIDYAD